MATTQEKKPQLPPVVLLKTPELVSGENFKVMPMHQSQPCYKKGLKYTEIEELVPAIAEQTVTVRARVQAVRGKGNMVFLFLRKGIYTCQALVMKSETISKEFVQFCQKISAESICDITGIVKAVEKPIEKATQQDVEIHVTSIEVISLAEYPLPMQIEDLTFPSSVFKKQEEDIAKVDEKIAKFLKDNEGKDLTKRPLKDEYAKLLKEKASAQKYVKVSQDTRLDNRMLDLRTVTNIAIFRIQSACCGLFREFLTSQKFVEIHTPKLIGCSSEGGSNIFEVKYFDRKAYLAQSPQLYKQMAIMGDFRKVFEVGPVFRAENSNTRRHLTEFEGLDIEMEIVENYHECIDVMEKLFTFIFDEIPKRFPDELKVIRKQYPFEDLVYRPFLRLTYKEAIEMLRAAGETIGDYDDFSTPQEVKLGELIKAKYNTDFYILDKFPAAIRPFYTMPDIDDPNYSNSYDVFVRGQEITSGAQRIHDPEFLMKRCIEKGVDPATLKDYIESFRFGSWPHAGCGIGLERITMLYLGIPNIRKVTLFPRDPIRLNP
ncbi:aspartyl-tRNA synthetase, cytoplasmic, putative [Entamoeba dispar SAW760]|uniref:aspartate--tRNA ligase n=1 Tax=Entamoeba dispar (strain ATCC PRA-260 / SAW760) TaxID=370354 RepID=B0EN72_ENTDS|nr:aspartyl-tRNA synthetase, cytoplasmic, putative [Entamoeba dispar SAW760]EDR24016.1 aspartyl-tRNA synthetase, cytoplasmic, putative [Entamoeba dispar SAW760]|eukprot:EDR24016.1 aspartyl-tRNA synthetase, cytoplasmic, putative [Entamoeba dispar SAW760]